MNKRAVQWMLAICLIGKACYVLTARSAKTSTIHCHVQLWQSTAGPASGV